MNDKDQLLQFLRTSGPEVAEKAGLLKTTNIFDRLQDFDINKISRQVAELDLVALRSLLSDKKRASEEFNNNSRKIRELRETLKSLEQRIEVYKDVDKIVDARKKQLNKIFKNLFIHHVEYVENNVTIFTTEFLKIKDRQLGIFRIWIDWNKSDARSAIRVINFYKRNGQNDHPCVQNGQICMGNADQSIREHYAQKDLFVLLETIISFLLSENISRGYIREWSVWLKGCGRVAHDFSFSSLNIRPYKTTPPEPLIRGAQEQEAQVPVDLYTTFTVSNETSTTYTPI